MPKLDAKVALVTGGTRGIGFAAAKAPAKEGAHVYITRRREPELAAVSNKLREMRPVYMEMWRMPAISIGQRFLVRLDDTL